jgi:hypothetical protein
VSQRQEKTRPGTKVRIGVAPDWSGLRVVCVVVPARHAHSRPGCGVASAVYPGLDLRGAGHVRWHGVEVFDGYGRRIAPDADGELYVLSFSERDEGHIYSMEIRWETGLNAANRLDINPEGLIQRQKLVSMFEMTKLDSGHVKK